MRRPSANPAFMRVGTLCRFADVGCRELPCKYVVALLELASDFDRTRRACPGAGAGSPLFRVGYSFTYY